MAEKDKKHWLHLFTTRWGYKPVDALRKDEKYNSKVSLSESLAMASDNNDPVLIHVVFPFENRFPIKRDSRDSIAIFPQWAVFEGQIFETEEPILYDGRFYSLDDFISECPDISLDNAESTCGTYTFSLNYLMLDPDEFNDFKKLYLTPIKKQVFETGIYDDNRGKNKSAPPEVVDRNQFIIEQFKVLGQKKPLPIATIKKRLDSYLDSKYPNDQPKADKLKCDDVTVRRVIDKFRMNK